MKLAGCPVRIEPPWNLTGRRHYRTLSVWVERIWEDDPPEGETPLEWLLVSTLPAGTADELLLRRDWYALRWPVAEDYHQAEKTGCGLEKVRFQDGHSLGAILAILSVLAVRVVQLRSAVRSQPDAPAESVATALEIELVQQAWGLAATAWTVLAFVSGVARLGGFLGRRCDGEPGWKVLWRGYQRLQAMVEGVRLHQTRQGHSGDCHPSPAAASASGCRRSRTCRRRTRT